MAYPVYSTTPVLSGTYVPEIFTGKLLVKFYKACVIAAISNTDYEGEIKAMGDTVHIRTIPDVSIRDYLKGQTLTYDWLTPDKVDLLINLGKYYGVNINDIDKLQSDIPFQEKWTEDAAEQMKIAIDTSILATAYVGAHAKNKGSNAGLVSSNIDLGSAGTPVTLTKANILDKIVEVGQVLTEQNVPSTDRWLVIPAWSKTRMLTSDLRNATIMGDGKSALRNGRIGEIDNFTIYESNSLPHATDGVECFHLMAGHRSALTFASQLTENEVIPNPNDFGKLMRGLQVYGWKCIKPEALVDIYATAGAL